MTVTVRHANDNDRAIWDAYVGGHQDATFFHKYDWRNVVEKGAGHCCVYLIAENQGEAVGILPLTIRRSSMFGKAIISSMFAVYGGPLADTDEAYRVLDEEAEKLALGAGIDVIEYRSKNLRRIKKGGWHVAANKSATFIKEIATDPEERMLAIPRKQRAVLRKALSAGLYLEATRDIDGFYRLYAQSVHRLGTPVFPRMLFKSMLDTFENNVEILIVKNSDGYPVASLLNFYDRDSVLPYYAGSSIENRSLGAHDFMYWHTMARAIERGKTRFDFGRSKIGSGPYQFKKNWGFQPVELAYEYRLLNGAAIPERSQESGKYAFLSSVWKKLPLRFVNTVGPHIARHLG
jgi:FemAB-related protein (PEP-CTERM system-associated)